MIYRLVGAEDSDGGEGAEERFSINHVRLGGSFERVGVGEEEEQQQDGAYYL